MEQTVERRFDAGSIQLSGIEATPRTAARGLVLAVHGAGYTSRYWDGAPDSTTSLLRLGRSLGFRVVAIDRPGYGSARDAEPRGLGLERQCEVLSALIARLRAEQPDVPLFLIGHSLGALLVVQLAAGPAAPHVAGIDVVGLPVRWRPEVRATVEALLRGDSTEVTNKRSRMSLYWGPPGTFDPQMLDHERSFLHRIPRVEMVESLRSTDILTDCAPRVRVPVQYTVAEFEESIAGGEAALTEGAALFASAPRVVSHLQTNAGHNVSLHKVGRAYHLRAFTFFEEVLASSPAEAVLVPTIAGADAAPSSPRIDGIKAAG